MQEVEFTIAAEGLLNMWEPSARATGRVTFLFCFIALGASIVEIQRKCSANSYWLESNEGSCSYSMKNPQAVIHQERLYVGILDEKEQLCLSKCF